MIVVIADDFTGAAELAGVALRFGLKSEVQTQFMMNPAVDVVIVDTNTRSKTADEALIVIEELMESLNSYEIDLLYKKTDSVFRGYIYQELSALLKYYPEKSVLLSPANPSNDRTISGGTYYIEGTPLHKTLFANDPETPVTTSDVYSLLNSNNQIKIEVLETSDKIDFESGKICIASTKKSEDVKHWANILNEHIIPAGAADFFAAILYSKGFRESVDTEIHIDFGVYRSLFVCGSSLSRVVNLEEDLFANNPEVVEISEKQICSKNNPYISDKIIKKVIETYGETNNVILYVSTSSKDSFTDLPTYNIPNCLAKIAFGVLQEVKINQLFIEGGTTSSEVVRKIGWNRLIPVDYIGKGVVRMKVADSPNFLIVKPGSYKWPGRLWNDKLNSNFK